MFHLVYTIIDERLCPLNVCGLRCGLLLILVVAAGGNWVVEQPRSSLLFRHPRMVWVCKRLKALKELLNTCQHQYAWGLINMHRKLVDGCRSSRWWYGWDASRLPRPSLLFFGPAPMLSLGFGRTANSVSRISIRRGRDEPS